MLIIPSLVGVLLTTFVAYRTLNQIGVQRQVLKYDVPLAWQGTLYTCVPTCVWMMLQAFGNDVLFNDVATEVNCTKDGTTYRDARRMLKGYGVTSRAIRQTQTACRAALDGGRLLLTTVTNYRHPHAVLVVGYRVRGKRCQFRVHDPLRPPLWRDARRFMAVTAEVIACNSVA